MVGSYRSYLIIFIGRVNINTYTQSSKNITYKFYLSHEYFDNFCLKFPFLILNLIRVIN